MLERPPRPERKRRDLNRKAGASLLALLTLSMLEGDTYAVPKSVPSGAYRHVVAMGDSYASGLGAANDDQDWCRKSDDGFAGLVARDIGAESFVNLACASAPVEAITNDFHSNQPQVKELSPEADLVLLTTGGNEINLRDFGRACISEGCGLNSEAFQEAATIFASESYRQNLQDSYRAILAKAPDATVVVVGYAKPIDSPGLFCNVLGKENDVGMSALVDMVNGVSESVVHEINDARLSFMPPVVDIDACSTMMSLRGLYFHFDIQGDSTSAGHFNSRGHAVQAAAVEEWLADLGGQKTER